MRLIICVIALISINLTLSAQVEHVEGQTKLINPAGRTLMLERDNEDSWLTFHDPNDDWYSIGIDRSNSGNFCINNGGVLNSSQFVMDGNGRIGIGTNDPSQKLHVKHGTIRGDLGAIGNSFIITGTGSNLQIKHDGGSQVALFNSGGGIDLRKTDGVSTILSAKNNGYVGIGTSSPDTPIEIYKESSDSHTDFLKITMNSWSASKNKNKSIVWDGGGNIITAGIGASYNGTMVNMDFHSFYNAGEKTDNDVIMRLQGNGNVGIGTTDPKSKLAVNGTITSKEVKVTLDDWSDFVFEDDYKLKDLEEVETFIEENKHLPDVPSEKEVLENGIKLGEMDAKLLQKIEELTLYMIEQNKITKKLVKDVQVLREENKMLKEKYAY